ncbi:MAG: hypothetical protein UH625_06050, partial [Muribaculaceae bacterium]|nr:hypothetical protein [Muribaculaceae bacterium]
DQPGLTPIWYSKVEEVDTEGKMEYEFKMIAPNNIIEKIGGLMPVTGYELHSAFSKGPQMVRKTVYKRDRMAYSKVEEESYDYGMVSNATHPELGFFKVKRVHTVIDGTDAPDHGLYPLELPGHDFSYGHKVVDKGAEFHSLSRVKAKSNNWPLVDPDEDARFWFKASNWTLFLATEQLRSTTRSKFMDGGTVTVTERHTYVPGTSLIQSTVVTNGHDSTRTDYSYAYTRSADVSQLMARRNITGMPVTVTETHGKATAGYTLELSAADSTLHPRRVWQIRDGNQWSHNTYTYNKQGFLTTMTTPAGVITRWTRDSRGNPTVMDQDNGAIVSKATWKPLVGVTSLTTPNGGKETYTYDSCSRLASRAVNSSLMEEYSYSMGLGGNYVMTKKYTSAGVFMRDYAIFDLLGRNHINQSEQPDGTFLSSLTEFDTMGRKWKEWLPVSAGERDSDTALRSAALSHYQDPNPWQETEYEESQR